MRRLLPLLFVLASGWVFAQGPAMPARDTDELLVRAAADSRRVPEALRLGAQIERSRDGRSFALVWRPAGAVAGWIVTLHGSGSWAHDEIVLWQPFAQKRQLGVIALQWWFGGGQQNGDYYAPPEMRREIERLMAQVDAHAENTLLHGFSRGSANLYALVALDGSTPRPLFRSVLANAGGMSADFRMNREIESGRFGATPFAGTRWWSYCGASDPNPERDGCPAMRRSQKWLQDRGAKADLTEDTSGDHGGFHRRAQNVERALDWFLGLL
jgi:predicted esterase